MINGWKGTYKIKVNDEEELVIHNRITNAALDEMIKVVQGQTPNLQIKFLALGTSNSAVTDTDTQLGSEIFRTQFASSTKTATGELTSIAVVLESEAVGNIKEIGVFGGTGATATANSGTLISRILWSREKTSSDEIQFTRIDKVVRA